jgi:hypothetical protein
MLLADRRLIKSVHATQRDHTARLTRLENGMGDVTRRLGAVEGRLGAVEGRLGAVEGRLGAVEVTLTKVHAGVDAIQDLLTRNLAQGNAQEDGPQG